MGCIVFASAVLLLLLRQFTFSSCSIHLPRALQRQDTEMVILSEGSSLSLPPIDFEQDIWEERIQNDSSIEPIEPVFKSAGEKFDSIEPMELEMKLPLRLLEVLERGATRNTALQVTILTLLVVVVIVLLAWKSLPSRSEQTGKDIEQPLPKPWTLGPLRTWNHGPWRPSWNVTKPLDLEESLDEKSSDSEHSLESITSTLEEKNQLQINPLCIDSALLL